MSDQDSNDVPIEDNVPECTHSPSGHHQPQSADLNSIPACQYCGKVI